MANNDLEEELKKLKHRVECFESETLECISGVYRGYKSLCSTIEQMLAAYDKFPSEALKKSIVQLSQNADFMGKNWDTVFDSLVRDPEARRMYQDDLRETTKIIKGILVTGIKPNKEESRGEKQV